MQKKRFLFVCGPARSGTTALARVVNAHERIAIGMERCKHITFENRMYEFIPALFDEVRFFDFEDGYTNMVPSKLKALSDYYAGIRTKFPHLIYIGDKVPNSAWVARHIHHTFPDTRYLFIIRDIFDTACSLQVRADKPDDPWAARKDATRAVHPWNHTVRIYARLKKAFPNDFHMVDYHTFFDADPNCISPLVDICDFLEVSPDDAMKDAFCAATQYYRSRVKSKRCQLDSHALQYIIDNADFNAYREATGRTVSEAPYLIDDAHKAA